MFISARRPRHKRLVAALAATYHPRKHFRLGQDIGWHWQIDDPNTLYRRRNRLTYTRDFSNAVWLKARCTAAAPAGGFTTITEDTSAAASHYWYRTAESAPVGTYGVYTLRVKKSATRNFALWVGSNASNPIDGFRRGINLSTGALMASIVDGSGVVEVSTTVTEYDATTWLITCVMQIASGGSAFGVLHCLVNGVVTGNIFYTGDGTSSIQAGYAQLETYTTTPTEYQDVPTTWAQAYLDAVGAERIYAWTDAAGTTPNTAVGEGIGLLLGREYGGARGPELLSNRSFENGATGWVATAPGVNTITISGGSARFQATGSADAATLIQAVALGANKVFHVEFDVLPGSSGQLKVLPIGGSGAEIVFSCTPGRKRFCSPVTFANSFVISRVVGQVADAYLTNFSVREIPGTHLTQATGTAKPTLSARVNALLATEQFDHAAWTKNAQATVTPNQAVAPDGRTTAAAWVAVAGGNNSVQQLVTTICGAAPTVAAQTSLCLKYLSGSPWIRLMWIDGGLNQCRVWVNVQTGAVGNSTAGGTATVMGVPPPESLGNGWYRFFVRGTQPGAIGYVVVVCQDGDGSVTQAAGSFYIWGADLRTADDASKAIPAYQRVGATAADHDTDGFPHFMEGDGTDNCMASVSTVDGSATDKLTVVAAVTKNSDAAAGVVLETTTSFSGNAGTMVMSASGAVNSWGWGARGSTGAGLDPTGYAAPSTAVLLGVGDIAADYIALSVNGVSAASSNTDRGIGNFGNHTLYVLSRAGSSLRFNGRFYGSTGRFGPMGDSERNNLTRWWQKRIGTA